MGADDQAYESPLPEGIDDMAGGPDLLGMLEGIDRTVLNGHDLVTVMRARSRMVSALQAQLYADMVELAHCPPGGPAAPPLRQQEPEEFVVDEIRAALTWTRPRADTAFDLAWQLVERLPAVWEALRAGRIDMPRAKTIARGTEHLDEVIAREIAETILADAENLTTGQIAARLRRLCVESDPDDARKRYEGGVAERRVIADPNSDGTADLLGLSLPPDRTAGIMDRLTELAKRRKTRDEARSMDQLRADIFLELLEGRLPDQPERRPMVDIRVGLSTLLELDDKAGEIPGWGPVIADIARQAVERRPDGEWRVAVTDPDTGAVLWDGTTRRRPTAAQRRYVEARQTTCSHPYCRMPARKSDIDHIIEWRHGGQTLVDDLGPACRHEHDLKTTGGWSVQCPRIGVYIWTSPHGHSYRSGNDPPRE